MRVGRAHWEAWGKRSAALLAGGRRGGPEPSRGGVCRVGGSLMARRDTLRHVVAHMIELQVIPLRQHRVSAELEQCHSFSFTKASCSPVIPHAHDVGCHGG